MPDTPTSTQSSLPPGAVVPATWVQRHPMLAFLTLAITFSWIIILPVLLSRNGLGLLPINLPSFDLFNTVASLVGPALAAFIVTSATSGQAGLQQFIHRITQWRVGIFWYALALFGYPLIYVAIGINVSAQNSLASVLAQWPLLFTVFVPSLLVNLVSTIGEEIGWVGYALPNLQRRIDPVLAAWLVGVFWEVTHLPAYFIAGSGQPSFSTFYFLLAVVLTGILRITWTWIFNMARESVIIIALLHASYNATSLAFIPALFPGPQPPEAQLWNLGLFYVVFPLLIMILTRGRLGFKPRAAVQAGLAHDG